MCAICLETSFNHVWGHVSTMFEDMLTPCLITYLWMFWTCLHNIWRHIQTNFEDMLTQFLKRYFFIVWRHDYTLFENMSTQCINTLWFFRLICIIFQVIFTLCMKTCLHKVTLLIALLQNIRTHIHTNLKWSCLKCFRIYQDILKGLKRYFFYCFNI